MRGFVSRYNASAPCKVHGAEFFCTSNIFCAKRHRADILMQRGDILRARVPYARRIPCGAAINGGFAVKQAVNTSDPRLGHDLTHFQKRRRPHSALFAYFLLCRRGFFGLILPKNSRFGAFYAEKRYADKYPYRP